MIQIHNYSNFMSMMAESDIKNRSFQLNIEAPPSMPKIVSQTSVQLR